MKISKSEIPSKSILLKTEYDYYDSFQGLYAHHGQIITPSELAKIFIQSAPPHVIFLMKMRDKLVSKFGLKTNPEASNFEEILNNYKGEIGQHLGFFKTFKKNDREIILGADDSHLNFRVSLMIIDINTKQKSLITTTTVKFNNFFGKLYFFPVKPFHKIIVKGMIKRMIHMIEAASKPNN